MIKLQITRYIENDTYLEEVTKYEKETRCTSFANTTYPERERIDKVLDVEVTEEQFEAIRKAVLEKF